MAANDCAFLLLSEGCNLRCTHCYVSAAPGVGRHMPLAVAAAALDLFSGLDIADVRLTGGEPTIHPGFDDILALARRRRLRVGLVSNGIKLLGREWGRAVLRRVERCWISLYGATADEHQRVAGAAAKPFADTIEAVGAYTHEGYPIGLSVLVRPGSLAHIGDLISAAASAGVKRLRFLPLQPDGRASGDGGIDWRNWPREVLDIARVMRAHADAPAFDVLTINDPFDLGERFGRGSSSCLVRSRRMWSVTPNGDVFPCCFTVYDPSLRLGNVMEEGASERLVQALGSRPTQPACRGLAQAFWKDARVDSVTCPIGSLDPRSVRLREHVAA